MRHTLLDWLAYWFVRVAAFGVQRLPINLSFRGASLLAILVYFTSKRRRVAYTNLKSAFPDSTPSDRKRWVKEMFQHLGMNGVEIVRFPILRPEDLNRLVTTHGYERYLARRDSKKGLILLTAHLGNWEFSQIMEGLRGRTMSVLARRQKFRRLDQFLNALRELHGSVSVAKGAGVRDLYRALREGRTIGVLGDQSGGDNGVWVRFFGRLTTSPRGPIALALKLDATLLPVFSTRRKGPYHDIFFDPPIELLRTGDFEKDIQVNTQTYIRLLEAYLKKYPGQWLWGHKRWKRTRTKRITILSDGKAGHVKQSETIVKWLNVRSQQKEPPYEILVEKIEVEFRSPWRRRLFPLFALFFIPWAQGRLRWLRAFLTEECSEKIERTNPDIVVSAGASLIPLNLCLVRENLAKSAVVMKPSFPFNLFRYDLALIPAHDRGLMPRGHFRIQGSLSEIERETLETSGRMLAQSVRNPERVRVGLFLGGETRNLKPSPGEVENLLKELEKVSQRLDGGYVMTTSRRTPDTVVQWLKDRIREFPACQLCVIAKEDPRPEVVPGMMSLADFLVVTEDSMTMITEALSSGKKVVIVKMGKNGLAGKHYRFQKELQEKWGVPVVETGRLSETLANGFRTDSRRRFEEERMKISERLESLL